MGLFDKVCSAETRLAHPGLYATKNNGDSFLNIRVNTNSIRTVTFRIEIFKRRGENKMYFYYIYTDILDMDYKCAISFGVTLLVAAYGSRTRCGLGKWQRRRLSFTRKLCLYCKYHATFFTLYNFTREI